MLGNEPFFELDLVSATAICIPIHLGPKLASDEFEFSYALDGDDSKMNKMVWI